MLQAHLHSHVTVFCLKQQIQCVSKTEKGNDLITLSHYLFCLTPGEREGGGGFHFTQETQDVFSSQFARINKSHASANGGCCACVWLFPRTVCLSLVLSPLNSFWTGDRPNERGPRLAKVECKMYAVRIPLWGPRFCFHSKCSRLLGHGYPLNSELYTT